MIMRFRNVKALTNYVNAGKKVEYIFFWGHRKSKSGISKACFSQWYESPFMYDDISYKTAEHFMMAEKARLFGDSGAVARIIVAESPDEVKKIGREINKFDEQVWLANRFEIVVAANYQKFKQIAKLKSFLFSTGECVLVEASPVDIIWGIGLPFDAPEAQNPNLWKGENLLGFALMVVREKLLSEYSLI